MAASATPRDAHAGKDGARVPAVPEIFRILSGRTGRAGTANNRQKDRARCRMRGLAVLAVAGWVLLVSVRASAAQDLSAVYPS